MDAPVWQLAMAVAEQVFAATDKLPPKEDYGFTSQFRRAAVRVTTDIAEAYGRNRVLDRVTYHYVARGSLTQTESLLEYGRRVGYIDAETAGRLSGLLGNLYRDLSAEAEALRRCQP